MKRIFTILVLLLFSGSAFGDALSGNVKTDAAKSGKNQVVDYASGAPIGGAKVGIPSMGYGTKTDKDGNFDIDAQIKEKSILSVEKEGYRPFSVTVDENTVKKPMKLGISQSKAGDLTLETSLVHLGDDIYSDTSANSGDFKTKAAGPFYMNRFKLASLRMGENAVLVIGSIIGLDTKMARDLGQNKISQVYSGPAEIYFNGQKIGELHINGDNQEIAIPGALVRESNEVTIKTGRNLFQYAYIDYDDMEFMNLRIEVREKSLAEY